MPRRLCLPVFVLVLLASAPAAAASGPLFAVQGGGGVLAHDGSVRYVAVGAGTTGHTELEAVRTRDGTVLRTLDLIRSWGTPLLGAGGVGLSHDGGTLVLASPAYGSPSRFLLVDPRRMRVLDSVVLKGVFSYDALSPDGSRLYLVQYTHGASGDLQHYVVRAYDLRRDRLLPGRIADRTQKSWVMSGTPMTRTTSADGRWVYTLYSNPGGFPFVHALDTARGVAHCVGLPWPSADQSALVNVALDLRDGGRTLAVHWRSGRPWLTVATTDGWRIGHSSAAGGVPWTWVGPTLGGGLALLAAAALLLRRRLRREVEDRPRQELGLA